MNDTKWTIHDTYQENITNAKNSMFNMHYIFPNDINISDLFTNDLFDLILMKSNDGFGNPSPYIQRNTTDIFLGNLNEMVLNNTNGNENINENVNISIQKISRFHNIYNITVQANVSDAYFIAPNTDLSITLFFGIEIKSDTNNRLNYIYIYTP